MLPIWDWLYLDNGLYIEEGPRSHNTSNVRSAVLSRDHMPSNQWCKDTQLHWVTMCMMCEMRLSSDNGLKALGMEPYKHRHRRTGIQKGHCTKIWNHYDLQESCFNHLKITFQNMVSWAVIWSFDFFFDLRLNQQLSKQWRCQWVEMPSFSFWRHCNVWVNTEEWGLSNVNLIYHYSQVIE